MATVNEEFLDELIRRQIDTLRYSGGLATEIVRLLDRSERDLEKTIAARVKKANREGVDRGPAVTKRLKEIYADVQEVRAQAFEAIRQQVESDMAELAVDEADAVKRILDKISPVDLGIALPKARQLASIVKSVFNGDTVRGWVDRMGEADAQRIADQISLGVAQGETIEQITARVLGTAANDWKDGVTQITRNGARTLARTLTNHVTNAARQDLYAANADIFSEEQYVATLDSRTTPQCRALDGKLFKIGEGPMPPIHWNCRSTRIPVIAPLDGDRASEFGAVPAKQTYGPWLAKQSAAYQDEVLGPERGKLFRDGGLKIERFVDKNLTPLTLAQLKDRYPSAWAKAFGADE